MLEFILKDPNLNARVDEAIEQAQRGVCEISDWELLASVHARIVKEGWLSAAQWIRHDTMKDGTTRHTVYDVEQMGTCLEQNIECRPTDLSDVPQTHAKDD